MITYTWPYERRADILACVETSPDNEQVRAVEDYARLDLGRHARTGVPEVVYGQGKTVTQTVRLLTELREAHPATPALATRCPAELLDTAAGHFEDEIHVDEAAGTLVVGELPEPRGSVLIAVAGTSDLPVARECARTLDVLGTGNRLLADVGVAGIGRLFAEIDALREAECVITVAGMDGALPSVIAGLVATPVIGVPTSVGYGVAAGGRPAASAMLASCGPGLVVVNIDNGFGAAVHAAKVIRQAHRG